MEGVNVGGILIGYVGLVDLGTATLIALGLLAVRRSPSARFVFASGLFSSAVLWTIAVLGFLQRGMHVDRHWTAIILAAAVLLLSGTGQFIAAVRNPQVYGTALVCTLCAMGLLALPTLVSELTAIVHLTTTAICLIQTLSLLPALASVSIALLGRSRRDRSI
jgi:hypothetical protein